MVPLEKDQRRKSLKFNLYNDSEIKLHSLMVKKNTDQEVLTIEIPYTAKSRYEEFDGKFLVTIASGIHIEDQNALEQAIKLIAAKDKLEKIKAINIQKLLKKPNLIASKTDLRPEFFVIDRDQINMEITIKNKAKVAQSVSGVKLSEDSPPKLYTEEDEKESGKFNHFLFIPVLFNIAGQQYSTTIYSDLD